MDGVPDPLRYVARALDDLGALVEEADGQLSVVLPREAARKLGIAESIELSAHGDGGTLACGVGSPLLEALVDLGRASAPLARLDRPGSGSPTAARALGESFVVRNGVCRVAGIEVSTVWYLHAIIAWTVEADERLSGLVAAGLHPDGPSCALDLLEGLTLDDARVLDAEPPSVDADALLARIGRVAVGVVEPRVAPALAMVARRHDRDHLRIAEYYGSLLAETLRPTRKVDPAAIAAKVAHLTAERAARLDDLRHRFSARVSLRLAAAAWVRTPTATVDLRVRRRKGERALTLRLPAGARAFDALPCDACSGFTPRPAFCDDRLHVLCERCLPDAAGRPVCAACRVVS